MKSILAQIVPALLIQLLFVGKVFCGVGHGPGSGAQGAGNGALNEITQHDNVAAWAAQSAVANAVGNDYQNQLSTTAQLVSQFNAPVTKQQASEAFSAVQHQQQSSFISQALANAAPAISYAANHAARDNFAQAYASFESGSAAADAQSHQGYGSNSGGGGGGGNNGKSSQIATNVAAIQAINSIQGLDRSASYGFTSGGSGSGGSGSSSGGRGGGGGGGY